MLVVGSRALKQAGDKYLSSASRQWDWDYICSYTDFLSKKKEIGTGRSYPVNRGKVMVIQTSNQNYEFEIAWENSSAASLIQLINESPSLVSKDGDISYASPDLIFTLKKSHRYLKDSPHFLKTMIDYRHLLSLGCSVPECLTNWYKERVKETYWYKHPKLDVTKNDFFKADEIPYIYDHDTIHLAMMHLDKPAYEYFKPEDKEVLCDKSMFFNCEEKIRLYAVLEEAYVLALERSQIPLPNYWTPRKSFEVALSKVASSITSGWFREYAYDHYFDVLDLYNDSYTKKFWKAVDDGIVRKL